MEIATESESVSHDEGISMPYEDRSNIRQVSVKATDQIGQSPIICIRGVTQGGGPSGAGALLSGFLPGIQPYLTFHQMALKGFFLDLFG